MISVSSLRWNKYLVNHIPEENYGPYALLIPTYDGNNSLNLARDICFYSYDNPLGFNHSAPCQFPRVTTLTLRFDQFERLSDSYITDLNHIIPLAQLTQLHVETVVFKVDQLVELL